MSKKIAVEFVYALPGRQLLEEVLVNDGATVADVIRAVSLTERFPGTRVDDLAVGIWGRRVERDRRVRAGDRVELYRPLAIDPKEARRRLALAGKTMADGPLRGNSEP